MISKITAVIACGMLTSSQAQTPKSQESPEDARLIQSIQGSALYAAYCAVCHGKNGKGDGPMAKPLKVPPPDFTRISGGRFPLARVRAIILGEQETQAGHGTREMPVWGPIFSQVAWDQDLGRVRADNLARYIETIQAK
jgi:mono/diheme cytochrome c family protein